MICKNESMKQQFKASDLQLQYIDPPMDSDDQTSRHSCHKLSNERHVVDERADKFHSTWL